jgi:uncharacterized protein
MICPVCGERLRPIERAGIEIDICPGCKGIWLDSGELDKLLAVEQAQPLAAPAARPYTPVADRGRDAHDSHHDDHEHGSHSARRYEPDDHRQGSRRRSSWLGDILGGLGGGED